mmetsp:Transcript_21329/g.15308  ORF Transcript_21329/g.15308 Transcript_21329/m.15308 type:complete len:90 (-) Transcript_21329:676-945(-)
MFLSDLLLGIVSEDFERFKIAFESAESLIRSQQSNDLQLMATELLWTIFRTNDKFSMEKFLDLKYAAIQAIIEKEPLQGAKETVSRIID